MSAAKLLGDIQATTMPGPIVSGFYSTWESSMSRYSIMTNALLQLNICILNADCQRAHHGGRSE